MAYVPLSDLPLGRAYCAICVRVVRLWDYCGNKEGELPLHVDMVLVDEKENRIYAEIPGAEADKFKQLIREGRVYVLKKFVVSACKPAYKPFPSSQMIRFSPWTTVEEKTTMIDELPKHVFDLVDFQEFPSRVGNVEYFIDTIGVITGISEVAYAHLPSNQSSTAKRVISLKDLRNNQINLVLWGSRATEFDAQVIHSVGQESHAVAIFVGMLLKSYKGENTLSGGSACKWYINEEIPEIEIFFDRLPDMHNKVKWISVGEQQFRALEQQKNLEEKTVKELRDMDPWEFEGSGYRCTVTISRINSKLPWWFSSCTKCHRASVPCGNEYKCSGGCSCTTAEPKYRLSLIGTDGSATAEFTLFGRVARQIIGKPVVSLLRSASKNQYGSTVLESEHVLLDIAALVSQKYTFSVSISQKNITQRNVSFQVNSIVTFFGKQAQIPTSSELNYENANKSLLPPSSVPLRINDSDVSMSSKKAKLDRKMISCRKHLEFGSNSFGGKEISIADESYKTENAVEAQISSANTSKISETLASAIDVESTDNIILPENGDEITKVPHNGTKSRTSGGKKRMAS